MRYTLVVGKISPVILLYSCIHVLSAFNPQISPLNPALFFGSINAIKGKKADRLSLMNIMP